ncbi:hypothetical protein VKT23_006312 [Stygiomarasmius scandens]|uniref:Uncharacterized protein n=1 Tax=Marasmiellus scandens TaxID=2682957 RepID=A0ABR1JPH3_9AGAR
MGCTIPPPGNFWRMFIPSLILHTLLFALTTMRALKTPNIFQEAPLMRRILRDGGIFYFAVIVVVGTTAIFSFFTHQPKINIPAIYSGALLCLSSVAISRLMLSIQSVADRLGYDESWVLNNIELSRVSWRKGSHDGEIIVEVDPGDVIELTTAPRRTGPGSPLDSPSSLESGDMRKGRVGIGIRVTRVGYLDDPNSGPRSPLPNW